MGRSIISNAKKCYVCGAVNGLEKHHCLFGTANRKKAEEDGLWVYLCNRDHQAVHHQDIWEKKALQELAQEKWESKYGNREAFMKRYGKNYLERDNDDRG